MTSDLGGAVARRLHPLTPVLRGWKWFVAVLVVVSQDALRQLDAVRLVLTIAIGTLVGVLVGALSWWFTRFGFEGDSLRIDSGVFVKRSRRVRLDRLQAVDVVRPLLARATGLAELRLEVAGGATSEAPLAYLSETEARALRAELLARAAGLDAATPEAPELPLVSVPFPTLLEATLRSADVVLAVPIGLGLVGAAIVTGEPLLLGPLLPGVFAVGAALYARLASSYGFTLSQSPDGLRIRKGLLDTRAQTVPPGRVQGVAIRQPLLWRSKDWVRLDVDVAGYVAAPGEDAAAASSVLLPVAPRAVALDVLGRVLPGVDIDAVPLVPAPPPARWLRPIGWRALAVGADERVLVTREGVLTRRLMAVPHAKTQSVRLTQGPLQRRLGLATVHVDTPPGPVDAVAPHRLAAEARQLVEAQAARARAARKAAGPERWMT